MGFIIFILFLALVFSLILSKVKSGKYAVMAKIFRIATIVATTAIFSYWFIGKSISKIAKNSVALQVVNKLPQPLDFYVITKHINPESKATRIETNHLGKIRSDHFRTDFLKMKNSDEYWVVGYLGKKNLAYFSQHSVPNKNIDQIVEVQNYINQSAKLSDQAKKEIEAYNYQNMKLSIWITLDFLLLFLNVVLIFRRTK